MMDREKQFKASHEMPTLKDMKEYPIVGISIDKQEVINQDFIRVVAFLDICREAKEDARSKITISFEYDDVPEEVYQVPEIRKYVKKIVDMYPEIFYYLHLGGHQVLLVFLLCLFQIRQVTTKDYKTKNISVTADKNIIMKTIKDINDYSEKINDANLPAIKEIYNKIISIVK